MPVDWNLFNDRTRQSPPYPYLVFGLGFAGPGRRALDAGCGALRDTRLLLECGYDVTALDANPSLPDEVARLGAVPVRVAVARFEDFDFGREVFDFVNAQFSLPFSGPQNMPSILAKTLASLAPGGVFCGNLFGVRDGWAAGRSAGIAFVTREVAESFFVGFEVLDFQEVERDAKIASGEPHHWHEFRVVARRA